MTNHYTDAIDGGVTTRSTVDEAALTLEPRRVWPDEPNVGWVEQEMAFRVDGAVRIGGSTLKTYTLNNLPRESATREARIEIYDPERKLQASEDGGAPADMLNAVGCWTSTSNVAVETEITWDDEVVTDARTYSWNSGSVVTLLRPGVYLVQYRAWAEPATGALTMALTVGGATVAWYGTGLSTRLTVSDATVAVVTSTATVSLSMTVGTSFGDGTAGQETRLMIVKLR